MELCGNTDLSLDCLPDEVWALVLSKCSLSWPQARTLLLWRPGAGKFLQTRPDLLAQLLSLQPHGLLNAVIGGRTDVLALLAQRPHDEACISVALHHCAVQDFGSMAALLCERATADARSTALSEAAQRGSIAVMTALLDAGVCTDSVNNYALYQAAGNGCLEAVRLLLDWRAAREAEGQEAAAASADRLAAQHSCVLRAAEGRHSEVVRLLLAPDQDGTGALLVGAARGKRAAVEHLLAMRIRLPPDHEELMLRFIVGRGQHSMARMYIEQGPRRTRAQARHLLALLPQIE